MEERNSLPVFWFLTCMSFKQTEIHTEPETIRQKSSCATAKNRFVRLPGLEYMSDFNV